MKTEQTDYFTRAVNKIAALRNLRAQTDATQQANRYRNLALQAAAELLEVEKREAALQAELKTYQEQGEPPQPDGDEYGGPVITFTKNGRRYAFFAGHTYEQQED